MSTETASTGTTSTESATRPQSHSEPAQADGALIEAALEAIAGVAPTAFLNPGQTVAAAARLGRAAVSHPPKIARAAAKFAAEVARIAAGRSDIKPETDKRFSDDSFVKRAGYRRTGQAYLAWSRGVHDMIDDLNLDPKSTLRSHFVASLITEAVAPTNTLIGNPAAIAEAVRTRGTSLRDGARHWMHDLQHNGGMPSMVDTRPFVIGENVAATPGSVVFRSEVLELIRYQPVTPQVRTRAVMIVPPQINKFYVLDLAPGRSLVEAAVAAGQQVFMISWRNPGPEQRDWDLDKYCAAILEATDVVMELTGQADLNLMGVCAGGITSAALLGYLAAVSDPRIHSVTFLVTVLDWSVPSTVGTFASGPAVAAAAQRSQRAGILAGKDLAKLFAWLRPNDLVWNYWVNNYLLGRNPPAFDVLAWNVDDTNLPAGLHGDFLGIASTNGLAVSGGIVALGEKVDLGKITYDAYVVGGLTDHITPWNGCYRTLDLLGGDSEFVLCASGHIQTLVCPTDNPKAKYYVHDSPVESAEEWKEAATAHSGSWWGHWLAWIEFRSGDLRAAPKRLGNRQFPSLQAAPGRYVTA